MANSPRVWVQVEGAERERERERERETRDGGERRSKSEREKARGRSWSVKISKRASCPDLTEPFSMRWKLRAQKLRGLAVRGAIRSSLTVEMARVLDVTLRRDATEHVEQKGANASEDASPLDCTSFFPSFKIHSTGERPLVCVFKCQSYSSYLFLLFWETLFPLSFAQNKI